MEKQELITSIVNYIETLLRMGRQTHVTTILLQNIKNENIDLANTLLKLSKALKK